VKIEISKELLKELCNNAYDGTEADDAVDHIASYHKMCKGDTSKLENIIPKDAPHSDNLKQPNEGICRVDKFKVIKYLIGDSEEFLAICTRECNSWAQTVNRISNIYHDIFRKKDEG
ncbi:hypothetical protein Tco_1356973, partial [Tanacetum coccineum]